MQSWDWGIGWLINFISARLRDLNKEVGAVYEILLLLLKYMYHKLSVANL